MAAKSNEYTAANLKKDLREKGLRPLYLLYGEESYLRKMYEGKIAEMVPDAGFPEFNRFIFEGADTEFADYDNALEGFPMMTDKKLIIIRDSGIFKKATDEVKEFWKKRFENLSDDTVVLFSEAEADSRGVLYKAAKKAGMVAKFEFMSDGDLVSWVMRRALKAKLKISKDCAQYMVSMVERGLGNLNNEFIKLENYCDKIITKTDIDKAVSRSASVQIFDLTDAIMYGDAAKAMRIMNELRTSNESAFGVLYLIEGNAEKILKVKSSGVRNKVKAAQIISVSPFIAEKYIKSAAGFSEDALIRMVTRVPEIDLRIKSGLTEQWTAVEQYISECIYLNNASHGL